MWYLWFLGDSPCCRSIRYFAPTHGISPRVTLTGRRCGVSPAHRIYRTITVYMLATREARPPGHASTEEDGRESPRTSRFVYRTLRFCTRSSHLTSPSGECGTKNDMPIARVCQETYTMYTLYPSMDRLLLYYVFTCAISSTRARDLII